MTKQHAGRQAPSLDSFPRHTLLMKAIRLALFPLQWQSTSGAGTLRILAACTLAGWVQKQRCNLMVGFLGIVWREEDRKKRIYIVVIITQVMFIAKRTCDQRNGFLSTGADPLGPLKSRGRVMFRYLGRQI